VKSQLVTSSFTSLFLFHAKKTKGKKRKHATAKETQEHPQQPEKKVAKHAMSEVCLLPGPSYSRGWACKAQFAITAQTLY